MAKRPVIDAEAIQMADGSLCIVYEEMPLEWFGDERGPAAMQLAEARARAKLAGQKVEN